MRKKAYSQLTRQLGEYGLKITSVAAGTEENVFAGCAAAGIPLIRIMFGADIEKGYMASEAG